MSEVVIQVESVSKKYTIRRANGRSSGDGIRHAIQDAVAAPWGALRKLRKPNPRSGTAPSTTYRHSSASEDFFALRDVSFEVRRGEVLGIIGRNGAGKSTLLKILSRITEPTKGRIGIKGRVASLLEVGTGFHPELTGRENIYLNGAILGMTRAEVRRNFDEIVEFAGVDRFLDTPVKHYSSGMYVRLAFAVAAHLEPDILIVDEVLAVGDVQFQKKCLGKMQEVSQSDGRTVLFVSHNLEAVRALCARGLYLADGNLAFTGSSVEAVGQYFKAAKRSFSANKEAKKNEVACFVHCSVIVSDPPVQHRCGKPMRISIGIECFEPVDTLTLSLLVTCPETGASCYIHYTDPSGRLSYNELGRLERGSHFRSCLVESFPGYVGEYRIQATLYCRRQQRTIDQLDGEASFEVVIPHDFAPGAQWPRGLCSFFVPHDWQIESPKSPSNACVETLTY